MDSSSVPDGRQRKNKNKKKYRVIITIPFISDIAILWLFKGGHNERECI